MDLQLTGKLALVTGSTAGIGFAIAEALAAEGAHVIVNGRTDVRVREACERIKAAHPQARLESLPIDLSTTEAVTETTHRFRSSPSLSTTSASTNRSPSRRSPMRTGAPSSRPTS